jgi:NAD(P)H-dependent FMN reductase
MANFPFQMYSEDREKSEGFSNALVEFHRDIKECRGLIISVNEHNGNPSAYFKNVLDWLSRLDRKFLSDKKILLMGTSGGKRGAQGSIEVITKLLPRFGGEIVTSFSLPGFGENFTEEGITDSTLAQQHKEALALFLNKI